MALFNSVIIALEITSASNHSVEKVSDFFTMTLLATSKTHNNQQHKFRRKICFEEFEVNPSNLNGIKMIKMFKTIAVTVALAYSSMANAGFVSYELTDELSADIQGNGDYTFQSVNDDLSIEYWLYDRLAMLRFSAESINYVFYAPFADNSNNELMNVTYSDSRIYDAFYEDSQSYEFYTFSRNTDFIDYVFQIDEGYTFTGLNFESKTPLRDGVFTNSYDVMYYEGLNVAALDISAVGGVTNVPEPSGLVIFGLAILGVASGRRFSIKK